MPKYKQYSPILTSILEQKGKQTRRDTTSLQSWPSYHGPNVRVKENMKMNKNGSNLIFSQLHILYDLISSGVYIYIYI